MPPAYTTTQKAAIANFTNFTATDKTTAARILKSHGWNVEQAVNGFLNSATQTSSNPFTSALNKLFDRYRDDPKFSPDTIGMENMMRYLQDLGVSVGDVGMLVVSELVQSPSMGEITRKGFVDGWSPVSADTIEKQRSFVHSRISNLSLPGYRDDFKRVYKHTFPLLREERQKVVALDTAIETLRVLLSPPSLSWNTPTTPWLDWWIEFLQTKFKKAVNKDMWDQTLAFVEKTLADESMSWWSEESAWPSVIDEFVEYVKVEKRGEGADGEAMEE